MDYASEGLLLLTDAPAIATALMQSNIEREYYLKVKGKITDEIKTAMKDGFFAKDATKGAHPKTEIKSMNFAPFVAFDIFGSSGGYTKLRVLIKEDKTANFADFLDILIWKLWT